MAFTPSSETMDVLRQAGYDAQTLKSASKEFSDIQLRYPDLVRATDKNFISHLKTKYLEKSIAVENNLNFDSSWRPDKNEIKTLEGEGYWLEIINDLLADFTLRPQPRDIIISKFAFFRSYIKRRYPLQSTNMKSWKPDPYLNQLIWQKLGIKSSVIKEILPQFKRSAIKKGVPGKLLPRYFFNYVKHNRTKIIKLFDIYSRK